MPVSRRPAGQFVPNSESCRRVRHEVGVSETAGQIHENARILGRVPRGIDSLNVKEKA